ncbi:MAG: hypothetical protein A2428_01390 [Bdellovibrionales bacterium RIFOXYC1_FULL_54_43]|nr:MAG: hypothetical protein A2428_01390 [Bdellovibrionales bacterium RIFOXYC1_FULL_54_43]OFZ85253.1 MAG: hypothetical protein A2603_08145 [Bdellovibrionales bacterium RIFOXYD1_FULL_55_31]
MPRSKKKSAAQTKSRQARSKPPRRKVPQGSPGLPSSSPSHQGEILKDIQPVEGGREEIEEALEHVDMESHRSAA